MFATAPPILAVALLGAGEPLPVTAIGGAPANPIDLTARPEAPHP